VNTAAVALRATPSFEIVAASATMSGTGSTEAEISSELRPDWMSAFGRLSQPNLSRASTGSNAAFGVNANANDWEAPDEIATGVLTVPVS
jgi:hypothetical protein